MLRVVYIGYNTGTRALPDMYALALGRCAPSGIVHIYQAMHSCLCYNLYIRSIILLYSLAVVMLCVLLLGYNEPYLLVFTECCIEVYHIPTAHWIQNVPIRKVIISH